MDNKSHVIKISIKSAIKTPFYILFYKDQSGLIHFQPFNFFSMKSQEQQKQEAFLKS